jgi:hypothetical protein
MSVAWSYFVTLLAAFALGGAFGKENASKAYPWLPCPGMPAYGVPAWTPRAGRLMVALDSLGAVLAQHLQL